jgi:hypothetical protein
MAAGTIIFSNSDFNPQNDLQGAVRAHQIGRTSKNHFLSSLDFLGVLVTAPNRELRDQEVLSQLCC